MFTTVKLIPRYGRAMAWFVFGLRDALSPFGRHPKYRMNEMTSHYLSKDLAKGPDDFSNLAEMVDFLEQEAGHEFEVNYDFEDLVPPRGKVFRMVKLPRPPLVQAILQR
jgi:hypothetical protein